MRMPTTRDVCRLAVILIAISGAMVGCATAGASADGQGSAGETDGGQETRKPPPEVTDHTADSRPDWARSVRPRARVRMDQGALAAEEVANYESKVERGAVQCYQTSLRETDTKAEGSIVYEVIVTRNGYVAGADMMSTALDREDVRRCVERVISRVRFNIPESNRPVHRFFFRVNFFLESVVPDDPPV